MNSTYATAAEVPEALKDHYKEADGKWVLSLDGDHPSVTSVVSEANKKVGEFRNNNIAKDKALTEAQARLDALSGVTPESYAAAQARITELEGKNKNSKTAEETQAIVAAALKPLTEALTTERNAREAAQRDSAAQKMTGTLTAAGLKAGVMEGAIGDFVTRGRAAFALVDGKLQAQKDGAPVYSTKRPGEILTVDEWASDLQAEASHLYKRTTGGGSGGDGDGSAGGDDPRPTIPRSEMRHHLKDVASGKVRIVD